MTEKHIEVLRACKKSVHFYDDLDEEGRLAISYLESVGFCDCPSLSPPIYWITERGKSKLDEIDRQRAKQTEEKAEKERAEAKRLEERREDHANEERRYRTQNKIAIIMPLVSFFLGVLAEHFFDIIGTLIDQIHALF